MTTSYKIDLDLTKEPPRSPRVRLGHFVILARCIDKCRATLAGKAGEYEFDCELDRSLLDWKGITGDQLKAYIAEGHSDDEIEAWVRANGGSKSDAEIMQWSGRASINAYLDNPENREWLEEQFARLNLPKETSVLFDHLDADDKVSFKK
ncbi:MAG: DUF5069 domain-containing protein [Patescibacteria group bacterium]